MSLEKLDKKDWFPERIGEDEVVTLWEEAMERLATTGSWRRRHLRLASMNILEHLESSEEPYLRPPSSTVDN